MMDNGKKIKMLSREQCADYDEDMIFADDYDSALIGVALIGSCARAVYSIEKMVRILIDEDGLEYEEAVEYLEFNTFEANVGERTPIYIKTEI